MATLDRVLELALLVNADLTHWMADKGLTEARTHLLWELGQREPCTQRVLAEAMGVTPRNVTGLVDALEDTGYVARAPHPTDRRATLVSLTARGAAVARGLQEERQGFARQLFEGMPESDLQGLDRGLDAVLARLRPLVAEATTGADRD